MVKALLYAMGRTLLLMWGMGTLMFILVHAMPGDPSQYYFSPETGVDITAQMKESLGLNAPLHVQYGKWLGSILTLDFQYSLVHHRPVWEMIGGVLPRTLLLGFLSILFGVLMGQVLGVYAALHKNSWIDRFISIFSLSIFSIPVFVLAIGMIFVFAYQIPIFPASGFSSPHFEQLSWGEQWLDIVKHLALPVLTTGLQAGVLISMYVRNAMIEVLSQDYIQAARAKGLSSQDIIFKHAFPSILVNQITILGAYATQLVGGFVLIESVFGWFGMGKLIFDSIGTRDYPVILGGVLILAFVVIILQQMADLLVKWVDPRLRNAAVS